jgi:hypothetical protein
MSTAIRSGVSTAAGWAQSRLEPQVDQVGFLALSVAGTAVLALRSAAASLQQLMYNVNQCYEHGQSKRNINGRKRNGGKGNRNVD